MFDRFPRRFKAVSQKSHTKTSRRLKLNKTHPGFPTPIGETARFTDKTSGIYADLNTRQANRVARIMTLGDSITYGISDKSTPRDRGDQFNDTNGGGGYRTPLWNKIANSGIKVDFVGTRHNGPAGFTGDIDHEGHSGSPIEQIISGVVKKDKNGFPITYKSLADCLMQALPDVVLVMLGTNNLYTDTSAVQMKNKLSGLIDQLLQNSAFNPSLRVFVATIPPVRNDPFDPGETNSPRAKALVQRAKDYNALLPGLVAEKQAQGKRIDFVDTRDLTVQNDISPRNVDSGVHPNTTGYQKIADAWFNALNNAIRTEQGMYKIDSRSLDGIENLQGSYADDTLIGDARTNVI
jgi:lysophospholipase L1-like esterase